MTLSLALDRTSPSHGGTRLEGFGSGRLIWYSPTKPGVNLANAGVTSTAAAVPSAGNSKRYRRVCNSRRTAGGLGLVAPDGTSGSVAPMPNAQATRVSPGRAGRTESPTREPSPAVRMGTQNVGDWGIYSGALESQVLRR
jgi:hypothetical protein